jgi:FkbM family methyltransferase
MPYVGMASEYKFLNSHYFCTENWNQPLRKYDFLLKTDCDVFLTENIKGYTPSSFLVGEGGYYDQSDDSKVDYIKNVAKNLGLKYRFMSLVGSSFFGKSEEVLNITSLQSQITEVLLKMYLNDDKSPFNMGVASMIAGEIAVNHCFQNQHVKLYLLDEKCWETTKIGKNVFHIHAWHTSQRWSKHAFFRGEYLNCNVNFEDAFLNVANYCQWIATTPMSSILSYKELYKAGKLNINYGLFDKEEEYRQCVFTNDNGVTVKLPDHKYSDVFKTRDNHEVLFRKIATSLILNGYVKNNIIDLGAWIGDNAVPWSKNIEGTVYAIDPSPGNSDFIRELIKINDIENIKLIQSAISDQNKVISTKMVFGENLYHCTFKDGDDGEFKMNSYSLDHLHEIGEIDKIDFIHLDVEGMEQNVVLGAEKIIQKFSPIITFEQHLTTDDYLSLSAHLMDRGYSVYLINEVLPGCNPDCRNFLSIKEELSEEIVEKLNSTLGVKNPLIPVVRNIPIEL